MLCNKLCSKFCEFLPLVIRGRLVVKDSMTNIGMEARWFTVGMEKCLISRKDQMVT